MPANEIAPLLEGLARRRGVPGMCWLEPTEQEIARTTCNHAVSPIESVAIDVIGHLPRTERGNWFITVVNDYLIRWPDAHAVADHEAEKVAWKRIDEWISRFGIMQYLHADQGREFESKRFFKQWAISWASRKHAQHRSLQSDGLVERNNRTIKDMLSKLISDNQHDWDIWIPHVLLAYRNAVQSSTGFTPHKMLFGRETRIPIDLITSTTRLSLNRRRHTFIYPEY